MNGRATIREADPADVEAINAILNDAVSRSTSSWNWETSTLRDRERWFADRRAGGWPVLVADSDGWCVGFATYGPFRTISGFLYTVEHSVYLAEEARGAGLGGRLMDALEEIAEARGVHVMVGALDADNAASIAFHRRRGYEQVGRMPQVGRKFGRWLDLVLVQKTFGPG